MEIIVYKLSCLQVWWKVRGDLGWGGKHGWQTVSGLNFGANFLPSLHSLRWGLGYPHLSGEHGLMSHTGDVIWGANLDEGRTTFPCSSFPSQNRPSKENKILTQNAVTVSWEARNALMLNAAPTFLWLFPRETVWENKKDWDDINHINPKKTGYWLCQ